jgi:hypothetical protein
VAATATAEAEAEAEAPPPTVVILVLSSSSPLFGFCAAVGFVPANESTRTDDVCEVVSFSDPRTPNPPFLFLEQADITRSARDNKSRAIFLVGLGVSL